MPMIDSDKLKPTSDVVVAAMTEWKDAAAAQREAIEKGVGRESAIERMEAAEHAFLKAATEIAALVHCEIEQAERATG